MLFQSCVQRVFSVDEPIVSLEENTARNPEFDYDRFKLAEKQSKLHCRNMICQSYLRLYIFLNDSAILRDRKKKATEMYT